MPSRTQHWIFKNNKYYYRLQSRASGIKIDILIPLEIDMSLSTIQQHNQAEKRGLKVHQQRKNLLNGIIDKTYFEWINDDKISKIVEYNIENAINSFLHFKKSNSVKEKTLKRDKFKLEIILKFFGKNKNIKSIKSKDVEDFAIFNKKNYSQWGFYNNTAQFKSLIKYIYERKLKDWNLNYLDKPIIDLPPKPKKPPLYFTEMQLQKILDLDFKIFNFEINQKFLKKIILFYRETGCRLSEPYYAELTKINNGKYLMSVPPEFAKLEQIDRVIYLTKKQKDFVLELQIKSKLITKRQINSNKKIKEKEIVQNFKNNLSKNFKIICKHLFGKNTKLKFHNLRHSYATATYLETNDIKLVQMKLGHTSRQATDIYTNFNMALVQTHFPSIKSRFFD